MSKLISIGELLIDFIPIEKGKKIKDVTSFERVAGGAPGNVAACVSVLGARSMMLSQLGEDGFGDHLIEALNRVNVDTSHIKRTKLANTALAFVSLAADGERDFTFYRNPSADMLFNPDDICESLFEANDILHFCSVDLVDYPVKKAHIKAIEYAHKNQTIVSFDPNLRFSLWPDVQSYKKTISEFIPLAHIIKVSDDELEFITGIKDEANAINSLFVGQVKVIILTKGNEGATMFTKSLSVSAPSHQVKAIDTTGAGDAFIGAILFQILKRGVTLNNLESIVDLDILSFAHATSSIVVTRKGAIPSMPTLEEVDFVLNK